MQKSRRKLLKQRFRFKASLNPSEGGTCAKIMYCVKCKRGLPLKKQNIIKAKLKINQGTKADKAKEKNLCKSAQSVSQKNNNQQIRKKSES
jgi:hypothetical protein